MKKILGLDLGTNSIGWAVVNKETDSDTHDLTKRIEAAGSRILPMDATALGDFAKGNPVSQTADRTSFRSIRRLHERHLLRRERLHRVLDLMGFLPKHYSDQLTRYGQIKEGCEPKLAWRHDEAGQWQFLFKQSYDEMLTEFRKCQPEWLAKGGKVPYDWTIYYLRKKALAEAISKEELAWLLLNFNQKRGYYQLRGEDEDESERGKLVEYQALTVTSVEATGEKRGAEMWYNIFLNNGMVYHRTATVKPDWEGKVKEFIVTTKLDKDGNPKLDKEGKVDCSLRIPKEDDWTLLKKKTEADIEHQHTYVGEYIYNALLSNPTQKVRGKLVRTVERKFYKEELIAILNSQKRFIAELRDRNLYAACLEELYAENESYRLSVAQRDFTYLFVDNIIFYQRPLRSKKSLINDCPYENYTYVDRETGEQKVSPIKCIAKSNPLYQESRLWQFVQNLRIYKREEMVDGRLVTDKDVTDDMLSTENKRVRLFDYLKDRSSITQNTLLGSFFEKKKPKGKDSKYPFRWNYVEDKTYPCNETRAQMLAGLKCAGISGDVLDSEMEQRLWHILYSVEDKQEITKALAKFGRKYGLGKSFVEAFSNQKPFKKDYGAYSEKAVKKLLNLMRMGKYWNPQAIDTATRQRIDKIINGEYDENISERVREKTKGLTCLEAFRGLSVWQACYVVYGRHSEAKDTCKWNTPDDIDSWLKQFPQHSLRNPIVEQIVLETLRTVRDIWKQYGKIDEIHVELGRDLKNPADKRKRMTEQINENENTNLRIKAMLMEFANPEYGIDNVRPYSPSQQELLRIYEDYALNCKDENDKELDFVTRMAKTSQPTKTDIQRYKLWLEQKYQSPYTGRTIPLAKLFTPAYEIEHIIPQSRYFDDSFSNKVICEAEVNKLKDRMLGFEFIKTHHGEKVQLSMGGTATVLSEQEYQLLVQKNYRSNRTKQKKLLMEDIPDQFIERQMNDSRYISKLVMQLLSNVVREEGELESTSKNVIACNGAITDRLKQDWGVNDVWNHLILPRFQRMDDLIGTQHFTTVSGNGHVIPQMPLELQKGFNKKRIDHRHHAMDAIVIACTTPEHVNLLNNEAAMSKNNANRRQLQHKLRRFEKTVTMHDGQPKEIEVAKEFLKPWPTFTADVEKTLGGIIVSFKQNLRVINKTSNHSQHMDENGKKILVPQTKGDSWAIRKPLHKETVFGEVNLRKVKTVPLSEAVKNTSSIVNRDLKDCIRRMLTLGYDVKRLKKYFADQKDTWSDIDTKHIEVYYFTKETGDRFFAVRKPLDTSFDDKRIRSSITDTGIQRILLRYLQECGNDPNIAFSPDGIDRMNADLTRLNNGKAHKPILKVRVYEKAEKFAVGQRGNKPTKFVEAAKGTNLFFAVYLKETVNKETGETEKKRDFATIPLYMAIERMKNGHTPAPDMDGRSPLFVLSPNDLVYLPTQEEKENGKINLPLNSGRIYKMVSCTEKECYFITHRVASVIADKKEFTPLNKIARAITGEMIKETCVPIKIDRLGNIVALDTLLI